MLDRDKVFDAIRNCITEPKCKDCPWEDCENVGHKRVDVPVTLMLDTLNLLKEQEPVEPIKSKLSFTRGFMWEIWDCGCCGNQLRSFAKYCDQCGQAVKWE